MSARGVLYDSLAHDPALPGPVSVSVVMPVHNAGPFLDASVGSVLAQTFRGFELVLLDDASTDGSRARLEAWAARDRRIRLAASRQRLGLAGSSNAVVALARAPLVARMDADDICHPERLERQLGALERHADAVLVGTLQEGIDGTGRRVRPPDVWRLARRSPFAPFPHGSILFRRAAFEAIGGYRERCEFWEDLDLYFRLAERGRVLVVPRVLYEYRYHVNSSRLTHHPPEVEQAVSLMMRCVAARRRGSSYDALLTEPPGHGPVPAGVHFSLASSRFWAGHPPAILARLLARPGGADLSPHGLAVLAFALWGAVHAPSLRSALRQMIRIRNLAARWRLPEENEPVEWRFE